MWQLSNEQRDYYRQQFRQISQEPHGHLSGQAAKAFFERSRLPSLELSKIWQLSDVDKDGALNIDEFCIAMHLVVLRRNSVDLPPHLPTKLRIQAFRSNSGPASGRTAELFRTRSLEQQSQVKHNSKSGKLIRTNSKKWTEFNSPTQDLLLDANTPPPAGANHLTALDNSVKSPPDSAHSTKLANFDFHASAVERDPKILHPIALRVSPQVNVPAADPQSTSTTTTLSTFPSNGISTTTHSSSSNTSTSSMSKKVDLPPPPPPPRPQRRVMGHARSSSLDLNHLVKVVPSVASASAKACPSLNPTLAEHTGGAFTAYKRGLANTIRSRFAAVPPEVSS